MGSVENGVWWLAVFTASVFTAGVAVARLWFGSRIVTEKEAQMVKTLRRLPTLSAKLQDDLRSFGQELSGWVDLAMDDSIPTPTALRAADEVSKMDAMALQKVALMGNPNAAYRATELTTDLASLGIIQYGSKHEKVKVLAGRMIEEYPIRRF